MQKVKQFIKKPECIIISFVIVFRVVYFFCLDYCFRADSYEYIARDGFAWIHGTVDRYRLPVYPMVIDICKFISEFHYTLLLCLFQLIVSLFSIIVLYSTIKKIIDKKWICLLSTFLYGTLNAVSEWDKTLLTESLSLSLTVFVIWGIVSFLKEGKYKYVIITTICLLFGCFLRAVFVIYSGLFFGFMILCVIFPKTSTDMSSTSKPREKNIKCALITSIPILLVFLYAFSFNNQYGGFTLSDSALGQQLYVVLEKEYYKDSSDVEIIKAADSILNTSIDKELEATLNKYIFEEYENDYNCSFTTSTYLARLYIMENYDRNRVKQFVNESKSNHLKSYLLSIPFNVFYSYSSDKNIKSSTMAKLFSIVTDNSLFFLTFTVFHSLIISVVELLSFVVILIKKKKVEWLRLGLGVYILSTILLSIFGTNGEFARIAITALPFMFVAIAIYINCFCSKIHNKTQRLFNH